MMAWKSGNSLVNMASVSNVRFLGCICCETMFFFLRQAQHNFDFGVEHSHHLTHQALFHQNMGPPV